MKKKSMRHITDLEPQKQRRLGLAREMVRVLGADGLSQVAGGSGCETTTSSLITFTTKQGI